MADAKTNKMEPEKMMKKMVRAVLFAVMAVFSTAVFAEDVDPCTMPETLAEIDGVYQIGTCGDLYKFAEMVNGGETGINGKLTADICLNACGEGESVLNADGTLNGDGSNFKPWTPILGYDGTFDGNGHTISGLYFNDGNVNYVGLFGFIDAGAVVQNVGVEDSYIVGNEYVGGVVGWNRNGSVVNSCNIGAVSGKANVGGVVGYNNAGTVSNVYNVGTVSGEYAVGGVVGFSDTGFISNVYNTGLVSGYNYVGGVVGENYGLVSNVYSTGAVSGNNYVGGVVGDNYGTINNVYNTGTESGERYVGGVVGYNAGSVSNVYNTGAVSGESDVGGVVGWNTVTVSNAYYNSEAFKGGSIGGGDGTPENVKGKKIAELVALTFGTDDADFPPLEGETESPWESGSFSYDKATGKLIARFPHLKNLKNLQQGTPFFEFEVVDNVIQIDGADDLKNFARLVNVYGIMDVDAELTEDIVVNENVLNEDGSLNVADTSKFVKWTPIGTSSTPYKGTFDGQGHTVNGLYIDNDQMVKIGFFGVVGSAGETKGVVKNVGVVDSYIKGRFFVGGVVGENAGIASSVFNTGVVIGLGSVGGVAGYNSAGTVINVYNTGTVSGSTYVGGVVGFNEGGSVSNVYSTGMVTGAEVSIGGVVGKNGGTVSYGYYNKEFYTGNAVGENDEGTVQNVEGKKTVELASTTLPAGFSSEIWDAGSGEPVGNNGKLVYKIPGLKNVGSQQEIEYTGFQPNAEGVYEISTAQELLWFAGLVNSGKISINGKLTANICVNACGEGESVLKSDGTLNVADSSKFVKWTPILGYNGTFDGNGHTVSGLYFNNENTSFVGFFGDIEGDAKVQNVGVEDSYFRGKYYVGGVVGESFGLVNNVYSTGMVSGEDYVGGVVGESFGLVNNVYSTGMVSGEDYVGGVVGYNYYAVSNVYNTGALSGKNYVGGVVGYDYGRVENAYFNTDFFEGKALGYGREESDIRGMTSAELATLDVAGAFDNSDGAWNAGDSATSNGWKRYTFPSLKGVGTAPTIIAFDPDAPEVKISNADELFKFAELVNLGNTAANGRLTADIVVNEGVLNNGGSLNVADTGKFVKWTPIGTESNPYLGTFDGKDAEGNAHVISGLYFNDEDADSVGLFGSTGENAKVQNVGVEDSYFRGGEYVGAVVGYVRESGEVSNVYSRSIVSGKNFVGGVAGFNDAGIVSNVYNAGSVSGTELYVGGVIGGVDNKGSVSNVYNMGSVGGTRFVIGGVVGFDNSAIISNAYFNTDFFTGNALGSGEDVENVGGKTSVELAAGTSLKLDTTAWVVGAVSENVKRDTLYYPYLKVFGPHKYVLGDVKKYAITVAVNDKAMGTVTGAGEYEYGTEVEITATANEGYKFTDWEDDVKTAARTITVTKAETYTANFEAIPSSSSEVESSSSAVESSSSEAKSSSSEAESSSSSAKSSSSDAKSSSSDAESSSSSAKSSSSSAKSSSSEAKSSSSEAKSSSSSAKSSSSSAKSSSSEAASSSSEAKSSSSDAKSSSSSAKSSSSSAKSSSSEAKSSSSEAKSSSSEAKSSSSSAKSSSSEAKSSSSEAKSSSSQKESIIAQAQLPQFSVTASGKMVSIAGARPNSIVNVFDMQGNMVKTVVATSANFTFALPSAGVYIVKNGYTAKRVNVR